MFGLFIFARFKAGTNFVKYNPEDANVARRRKSLLLGLFILAATGDS